MKRINKINQIIIFLLFMVSMMSCDSKGQKSQDSEREVLFKFAFLTDVHMNDQNLEVSSKGLRMAQNHAKENGADFIIFGGDVVDLNHMGAESEALADSLLNNFKNITKETGLPVYYTVGNHDRYYTYQSKPDSTGLSLFKNVLGEPYYSFDHKGFHFLILNSTDVEKNLDKYYIPSEQVEWIKSDLKAMNPDHSLIVATHVPFQSLYYPAVEGVVKDADMFHNFKEVWDILQPYNPKAIFQGHQHLHEELFVHDTWFLTGGAVSAAWWGGPLLSTQEGYMLVTAYSDGTISWKYTDYGWEK